MDRKCCIFCDEIPPERLASTASEVGTKPTANLMNQNNTCAREGPVTRNPFFNYLRYKRSISCSHDVRVFTSEGAKEWKAMTDLEKCPYVMEAHKAPKRYRRRLDTLSGSMSDSRLVNSTMNETKARSMTMNGRSKRGRNLPRKPVKRLITNARHLSLHNATDFGNISTVGRSHSRRANTVKRLNTNAKQMSLHNATDFGNISTVGSSHNRRAKSNNHSMN